MTASSYHLDSFSSTELGPEPGENLAGVQLPQADLVHQTAPGLFDQLPESSLTDAHRALQNWPLVGDRMLVALALPVSGNAKAVAGALLWHGWSSFPSRERLSALTGDTALPNITRGINELEKAGIVSRRKRLKRGRGYAGNTITFDGLVVCEILVKCPNPNLAALAQEILDCERDSLGQGRGINLIPRVEPEGQGRGINLIPRDSDFVSEPGGRGINLIPPGVSHRYYNHDLIDIYTDPVYESINQKVRGINLILRGSVGPCQAYGLAELTAAVCPGCGAEAGAADDSSAWPEWYKELAGRVDSEILPAWGSLYDDQQLAGWSDAVMVEAAERYAGNYASKQVTSPSTLFRKIANGVMSEQRRSGRSGSGGGSGSGSRISGRRAGGSGVPGDAGRR